MSPVRASSQRRRLMAAVFACGAVLLLAPACGPISGLTHIVRARIDIDLAETAGADKYALYEIESARLYLHKAKEEYGYSDFVAADDYGIEAGKYAKKARTMAESAAAQQR